MTRPFHGCQNFWPSDLDLEVWPTFKKNFNLGHSFLTRRGRALILHMFILLWQDLSMGAKIFDLVTLTLKLTYFQKNFNLGHRFLTRRGRAFILHMYIPCDKTFPWVPKFLTLWPWHLTYFKKNFNLGHSFLTRRGRAFILHMCIPCSKTTNALPWFLT